MWKKIRAKTGFHDVPSGTSDKTAGFHDPQGQHHSFPIGEDQSQNSDWIIPITKKLGVLGERSLKSGIYKVPNKLRRVDEDAYIPHIVSIGPFHSPTAEKHDHLLAMQEHKWWYTLYLLNRTKNINQKEILAQCGEAILEREQKVRRRYAEKIKFEPQELMEIMLVDGCFILELFLRSLLQDFTEEDPIFHNAWMIPTLRHDLALLENQIPFFILEELFNIVLRHFPEHLPCSITDLALSFFHPDLNLNQEAIRKKCGAQGGIYSHLLDILHNFYLPTSPKADPKGKQTWGFRKCATKLSEAGVEFEKGKEDHLFDICFSEDKGVITIPPLRIDETTKSLLMNLIAFQQCLGSTQQHITSYAILLKCLVQSPVDIELLEKEDIIKNELGGVGDVLTLFNNILRDVVPKDFYFGKLCEDVNAYQQSWWQWQRLMAFLKVRCYRYIGVLKSDYFSSPWSCMCTSFLAASALLVLTVVQTYYAVLSHKNSN